MTTRTRTPTTTPPAGDQEPSRCTRTLPLLLTPLPGEALDSWPLAYAHRLGTPVGDLLSVLGLRPNTFLVDHTIMLHPDETARAARLTGLTPTQLDAMTPVECAH
jgi:hypothetical protein